MSPEATDTALGPVDIVELLGVWYGTGDSSHVDEEDEDVSDGVDVGLDNEGGVGLSAGGDSKISSAATVLWIPNCAYDDIVARGDPGCAVEGRLISMRGAVRTGEGDETSFRECPRPNGDAGNCPSLNVGDVMIPAIGDVASRCSGRSDGFLLGEADGDGAGVPCGATGMTGKYESGALDGAASGVEPAVVESGASAGIGGVAGRMS